MSDNGDTNVDLFIKIAYFTSLAGASILFGFSRTLSKTRNKIDATTATTEAAKLHEEGVALARKALFKATLYSVCGFGLFSIVSYKLFIKKWIKQSRCDSENKDNFSLPE